MEFKKNFYTSILYNLIFIVSFFCIYKIIILKLGNEQLGLWSYTLAIGSLSISLVTINGSNYIHYFKNYVDKDNAKFTSLFVNFFLLNFFLYISTISLLVVIVYYFQNDIYKYIPKNELWDMIYLSFIIYFFNNLSVFVSSFLELKLLHYKRNIVNTIGVMVFFVLVIIGYFTDLSIYKILQFQILQYFLTTILFLYLFRKHFELVWENIKLEKEQAVAILSKNLNLQFIGISSNLIEPILKFFITSAIGLAGLGIFETAYRIVLHARNLVVTVNQFQIAESVSTPNLKKLVTENFQFIFSISIIFLFTMGLLANIVSFLFFNTTNSTFIILYNILIVTYFINIQTSTAYFTLIGKGIYTILTYSHLFILISATLLGYLFLKLHFDMYIVFGWSIALMLGSGLINYFFVKKFKIQLYTKQNLIQMVVSLFFVMFILLP